MDDGGREKLEGDVRRLCEQGDHQGAATVALKGYGPEIFGFLVALHRSEEDAADVFSIFSENLWKGLPGFAWSCTLRTWSYTIARNTSYRFKKTARRKAEGRIPLSAAGELAQKVRTETLTFMKTAQKDKFAALRESLPEEDQTLLILRIDRGLAWEDLARVMMPEGDVDADTLKKESARLRKRFQLVKEKLLEMGKRTGLLKKE